MSWDNCLGMTAEAAQSYVASKFKTGDIVVRHLDDSWVDEKPLERAVIHVRRDGKVASVQVQKGTLKFVYEEKKDRYGNVIEQCYHECIGINGDDAKEYIRSKEKKRYPVIRKPCDCWDDIQRCDRVVINVDSRGIVTDVQLY